MPKLKLTKTLVDAAQPENDPYEIRDTMIPGFLLKVTPTGRKIFMVAYVANNGQRRTRADIANLMKRMSGRPTNANRVLAAVRKMFNMAEVWGMRPDGSNPCRHIPKFPERGKTRLITDAELKRLYVYLDKAEAEGLEHSFILLAIRLQFEFAARMSETLMLEWAWIDLDNRRVEWPDSKTGGMSKPMSAEAVRLFETAPRFEESPYVCPSIFDPNLPMSQHTYWSGWRRVLERAGLPHIGTHGIRHRSATDIANSGIPVKVGMALTAHKTVTMFMRYVHTEDDPVRAAAEAGNLQCQALVSWWRESRAFRPRSHAGARNRTTASRRPGADPHAGRKATRIRGRPICISHQTAKLPAIPPPRRRKSDRSSWDQARWHGGGIPWVRKPINSGGGRRRTSFDGQSSSTMPVQSVSSIPRRRPVISRSMRTLSNVTARSAGGRSITSSENGCATLSTISMRGLRAAAGQRLPPQPRRATSY
jgi:integrase